MPNYDLINTIQGAMNSYDYSRNIHIQGQR